MAMQPLMPHPYHVDVDKNIIHIPKHIKVEEVVPQALHAFKKRVYVKVDPSGMNSIFFCYRDALGKIHSFNCTQDAEGEIEMGELHEMSEIKNNPEYTKVTLIFGKIDPESWGTFTFPTNAIQEMQKKLSSEN